MQRVFSDNSTGNKLIIGYIDTKVMCIIEANLYMQNLSEQTILLCTYYDDTYGPWINKSGDLLDTYTKAKDWQLWYRYLVTVIDFFQTEETENYLTKYGVKNIRGRFWKPEYSSIRYLGEGLFALLAPVLHLMKPYILPKQL